MGFPKIRYDEIYPESSDLSSYSRLQYTVIYSCIFWIRVFFPFSIFRQTNETAIAQVKAMAKSYPKYSFYTCDIDDAPLAAYDAEVGTTTSRCVLKRVDTPQYSIFMALVVPKMLINHGIFFFAFPLTIFSDEPQAQFSNEPKYIMYIYIHRYIHITHIHTCIISIIFHTSYYHMISSYIFHDISPLNYHDISTLSTVSLEVTEVPSVVIQPLGLKPDGLGLGRNQQTDGGWWMMGVDQQVTLW